VHVKPQLPRGLITALITPSFNDVGSLRESLSRLIEFQLRNNVIGFFTLGTYGEGLLLPVERRMLVLDIIAENVPSGFLIINNVSALSIEDSVKLAKHSIDIGVDKIASLPPMYYNVGVYEIKRFFNELGRIEAQLFIYNNPRKVYVDISPALLKQIAEETPSLIGIKDSSGSIERLIELVSIFLNQLYVGIASDTLILDAFLYGADAHICGVCNAIPELAVEVLRSVEKGDLRRAMFIQTLINEFRSLSREFNVEGVSLVKASLKLRGIDVGDPFTPLRRLSEHEVLRVKSVLDKILSIAGIRKT